MPAASPADPEWIDAGPAEELPVGSLRRIRLDGAERGALCLGLAESGPFAIDDFCPHAGGSLSEGMIDGNDVVCPLHAYGFDIRSGACAEDPGCSVRVYEVRQVNGKLQVRT